MPKRVERLFTPANVIGKMVLFTLISALTVGGAFFLRDYTVKHLPLWTDSHITALAVMPDDMQKMEHRMPDILNMKEVKTRLRDSEHYLVYFLPLPPNYIMRD